ncbi:MAG TPA: hypothetical protein PLO89_03855 [Spirochaetota bacterium]|nr:hypothetical protein [Spirochaetota bacterium]
MFSFIIKGIKKTFDKIFEENAEEKNFEENEYLVSLVQLILENEGVGKDLRKIIYLDKYQRILLLNDLINNLKKDDRPTDLINAVRLLFEDEVVEIIKNMIPAS